MKKEKVMKEGGRERGIQDFFSNASPCYVDSVRLSVTILVPSPSVHENQFCPMFYVAFHYPLRLMLCLELTR